MIVSSPSSSHTHNSTAKYRRTKLGWRRTKVRFPAAVEDCDVFVSSVGYTKTQVTVTIRTILLTSNEVKSGGLTTTGVPLYLGHLQFS